MNIKEKIDQMKDSLSEEDVKRFERDYLMKLIIDETYDDTNELFKFLMTYNTTFVATNNLDIDEFINDLRRAYDAYKLVYTYDSEGH